MSRMGQYVVEQEMLMTEEQLWERERERHESNEAARAAYDAEERARLEAEPELPFPPLPERPRLPLDEELPF